MLMSMFHIMIPITPNLFKFFKFLIRPGGRSQSTGMIILSEKTTPFLTKGLKFLQHDDASDRQAYEIFEWKKKFLFHPQKKHKNGKRMSTFYAKREIGRGQHAYFRFYQEHEV